MLVVVAIVGLLSTGTTMAIGQVFDHNTRSTAHMSAVQQVESAVHWLSRDSQMAQTVTPNGGSGFPLTLTWVEWDNTTHDVTYALDSGNLKRSHSVDSGAPSELVVANNINPDAGMTNCSYTDGIIAFKITSSVSDGTYTANETAVHEVVPRPGL